MSLIINPYVYAASGGSDPFWSSVTSLLHMNGADGSIVFTDQTGTAWTRAAAQIDTDQFVFGGASMLANGGYISATTASKFDFGTGDFTIECRVRPTSFVNFPEIFNNRSSVGNNGISFRVSTAGKLTFFWGPGTNQIQSTSTLVVNTWYAVALVRSGTTVYIFINGNLEASVSVGTSDITVSGSATSYIGRYGAASTGNWIGWIDEFRATKGVARYTSSYSIAASEFPNS